MREKENEKRGKESGRFRERTRHDGRGKKSEGMKARKKVNRGITRGRSVTATEK